MVCKYCGAEMPDFAVFCGQCGKTQPEEPAAQPEPAGVSGGSAGCVTPIEENGKLTCPVCGAKGQPKGRTRCWQCATPFVAGVSVREPQSGYSQKATPAVTMTTPPTDLYTRAAKIPAPTAFSADGSGDCVVPYEENGKLTCPLCGASGQPKNLVRCWQCAAPFAAGVSIRTDENGIPDYRAAERTIKKYPVSERRLDADNRKLKDIKISQYGSIGMAVMLFGPTLIYVFKEYSLQSMLDKTPGSIAVLVFGSALLLGVIVWKTIQRIKYTKRLRNLNNSYLIVAERHVYGNALPSVDAEPVPFSVPIDRITDVSYDMVNNFKIYTADGETICLPNLSYAGDAAEKINALRDLKEAEQALNTMNTADIKSLYQRADQFDSSAQQKDADAQVDVYVKQSEKPRAGGKENAEQSRKKKKRIRIALICAAVLCLCVAAIVVVNKVVIPKRDYNAAMDLYNAGDYRGAFKAFDALGNYKDAKEMKQSAIKKLWTGVLSRQTVSAENIYKEEFIVALKNDGTVVATGYNYDGQCNVSDWRNIVEVATCADATIGLKADGTVLWIGRKNYSPLTVIKDWRDITAISANAGTVYGLQADGTVISTDDHLYDHLDLTGWKNIVAISAGWGHIVGLQADGTVVAMGNNKNGQCNVSGWTDIIAISAGAHHTVGLKADGSVVAVGENDYGQCDVSGWRNIEAISTSDDYTFGLKADGTVIATRSTCDVHDWKDIVGICDGFGIKADGTIVSWYGDFDISGWRDICPPK